jgi:hypothetical protein
MFTYSDLNAMKNNTTPIVVDGNNITLMRTTMNQTPTI